MNSSGNQANSATRGGMGSVPTPANSGGSGIFGSTAVGATHGKSAEPNTGVEGNRRPSQESGPMFGGLSNLKRNSGDAGQAARRTSLSEQNTQPGMLGKMWQNFTKGPSDK